MNRLAVVGALALCVMFAVSSVQAAHKVAVYMSGKHQSDEQGALVATALTDALGNNADFAVTERTKEFLNTITKENLYQFSGAVDNSQIAEVGKKLGATYICVAELMSLGDFFPGSREVMLTARFINVESATIVGSSYTIGVLGDEDAIFATSEKLAGDLIADFNKRSGSDKKLDHAAIYSAGGSASGIDLITQPMLIHAVVRSGKYAVSERTGSFLETISQELGMQYSGEVDDNQLAKLGVQSGVKFVMTIKKISQTRVNIRMLDVKTGEIVPGMSKTGVIDITNVKSIETSMQSLISSFLKTDAAAIFVEQNQAKVEQERQKELLKEERERAARREIEERERHQKLQAQAEEKREWRSMQKPGVAIGFGASNGASMFGIGGVYTYPITRNVLAAPEANILLGTYENRGFGEDKYTFAGINVPIMFQYITSATSTFAAFAEAGAEVDYLIEFSDEGASVLNYGPAAGAGVILNFGGKRLYFDLARFCYGSEYLSYTANIRVMF
jgi:curli biogenesis system outer membrane secretion channel CsgG